jgi:hypothetical protein
MVVSKVMEGMIIRVCPKLNCPKNEPCLLSCFPLPDAGPRRVIHTAGVHLFEGNDSAEICKRIERQMHCIAFKVLSLIATRRQN